jgi:hypothetical protein
MGKGSTGAAAGGGAIYGLGIFGALFYYWQQADAFWEYIWAIFPKAILWPAFMVYEGFRARRVTADRSSSPSSPGKIVRSPEAMRSRARHRG